MPFLPHLFLVACAWMMLWPRAAHADVRRCVTASGQTIFTDRKCEEVDAVERLPRDSPTSGTRPHRAGGCARTLQDLVFEMTAAIDGRDANRLAAVYHWPGMSVDAGYRIWSRLDVVANRPLVDIVPVMPVSRPAPQPEPVVDASRDGRATEATRPSQPDPPADPDLYPQTSVRRDPVGLRVEQTLGNGSTPARTVFGLTRHFGCWWLRL